MNLEVIILAIIVLTVCQTKQTSVSDLYDIMHDIHSDVIHSSTELYYRLDEYSTYISHASHETHESFIKELNINVDYYTYYITKIEEEASAGNLDISSCIHSANSHINALNENLMSSLRGLDELETGAQSLMEKAYLEIYTEPKFKLDNMWSEVEQCLNDDCATELQRELMKQHQNMTQVMNESYTNVERLSL
ncbi:uncharacterized protein LOC143199671 isoform X2 [Rhynchophorus ferrugineus]|uniref:uncharacterized protein LOC143199671 isoform X2 n=1 Tax=Rhynchophorus ferrugineus TaxID=354439 RepID=UPI003FCC7E88